MKGIFKSYDEKTGQGTITSEKGEGSSSFGGSGDRGPQSIYELSPDEKIELLDREVETYEFTIPQELAHKTNIKVGASVEFDVKEGTREVTHLHT